MAAASTIITLAALAVSSAENQRHQGDAASDAKRMMKEQQEQQQKLETDLKNQKEKEKTDALNDAIKNKQISDARKKNPGGLKSTIKTSPLGDTSIAPVAAKQLLGM